MACNSAVKIVSDIFRESHTEASAIGCAIVSAVGAAVGTPIDYTKCFDTAEKFAEFTIKMVSFWNKMVGSFSWALLGPRRFEPGVVYSGTLVGTGGRMFIMPYPAKADKAIISIVEKSGRAETEVNVCKYNEAGGVTNLATRWFNTTEARQDSVGGRWDIEVSGIKNQVVVVNLDAKSVLNSFAYTLCLKFV